jgi:hypothetical protein
MVKNINKKIFTLAFRSALLVIGGFFIYEILKEAEHTWLKYETGNYHLHLIKKKIIHFVLVFFVDLFILYLLVYLFKFTL